MADNKQLRKWLGANINQYLEWLKDKDKDKDKDKEDKENGLIENFFIKQQLEYVISLL